MKFKNPEGEVIEVSVPAGFAEMKAEWHWISKKPDGSVWRLTYGDCAAFDDIYCYCTDNLHGVEPTQTAALPPLLPNSVNAELFTTPRYASIDAVQQATITNQRIELQRLNQLVKSLRNESELQVLEIQYLQDANKMHKASASTAQAVVTNQRIELKNLNATFDDFKREAAKSNRNLLEVRDDLRKELETKDARIKKLEFDAETTPAYPKGQWWYLSKFGLGWCKLSNEHLDWWRRNLEGYQIKFIPEGEAFRDLGAHELAIRKDECEKCAKENGSLREDIDALISDLQEWLAATVTSINTFGSDAQSYFNGKTAGYEYAIDQLKTIVAKGVNRA